MDQPNKTRRRDALVSADWRRVLRRKITWLLLAKLAGLILLWGLFFSPQHRIEVTPERASQRLAIGAGEKKNHD